MIMGDNVPKVTKRYQEKVVGDTPEGQVLDCHIFAYLKEAAGLNVVMTYHLDDDDDDKFSFCGPTKVFKCLERTLNEGGVSDALVIKDWDRIWDLNHDEQTWARIVTASGGYIDDVGKRIRSGVRRDVEVAQKVDKISPCPIAEQRFREMYDKLRDRR